MNSAWRELLSLAALLLFALERGGEGEGRSRKAGDLALVLALAAGYPGGAPENILGPLIALLLAAGLGTLLLLRAPAWSALKDPVPALAAAAGLGLAWSALLTASPSGESEGLLLSLPGVLGLLSGAAGLGLSLVPASAGRRSVALAGFPALLALILSAWYCGKPEDDWALPLMVVFTGLAFHLLGRSLEPEKRPGLRPMIFMASGLALAMAGQVQGFGLLAMAGALSAGRAWRQARSPAQAS